MEGEQTVADGVGYKINKIARGTRPRFCSSPRKEDFGQVMFFIPDHLLCKFAMKWSNYRHDSTPHAGRVRRTKFKKRRRGRG